jgi:alpha-L-fucosidase
MEMAEILKDRSDTFFASRTTKFMQIIACVCGLLGLSVFTAFAYNVVPKMAWWYDARFGMFIHFGSYSYHANGEWAFFNENYTKANYQTQVSAHFNPANFNAASIVGFAKAAGMKYIVITAKHHEGFAMWHSQVASFTDVPGTTLYNLYDYAGFHRDLLMELKNACDAQGIKFCLYYSIMDWDHPSQTANHSTYYSTMSSLTAKTNYIRDMKLQLGELITNYQPAVLWFDGDWCGNPNPATLNDWWIQSDATNLYNYLIGLKPDLVINERVKRDLGLGDFACPEQTVPTNALARPWETCATMNGVWGYTSWAESNYRSASNILSEMVQVLARDGNYLLNIGPKGDGTMTPGSTNILGTFATWMNTNSESVHGTTASPYGTGTNYEPSWGYYTKKPGKVYAHVFNWPGGGTLQVPVLSNAVNRVYLLNDTNHSLSYTISGGNINISVPTSKPTDMDSVVVVAVAPPPLAASKAASPNQVTLSWPTWATNRAVTGYVMYGATNLIPPIQWRVVTNVPQTNNAVFNLTLPTGQKQQYFMLGPP